MDLSGKEQGAFRRIAVSGKSFEFDRVFSPDEGQEAVYHDTAAIVTSVLDGYNACVFAYGQTGSGKTYTMNGTTDNPGVNFRALQDLFRLKAERKDAFDVSITVSMMEIYNESLKDLLREDRNNSNAPKLEIKKGQDRVYVPDLTRTECENADEVWQLMSRGARNRASGATSMNEQSSRSHLIVSVLVQSTSKLNTQKSLGELNLVRTFLQLSVSFRSVKLCVADFLVHVHAPGGFGWL